MLLSSLRKPYPVLRDDEGSDGLAPGERPTVLPDNVLMGCIIRVTRTLSAGRRTQKTRAPRWASRYSTWRRRSSIRAAN